MTPQTIFTYQVGLRSKDAHISAKNDSTGSEGRMLQEELTDLPDGTMLHTIAIRWRNLGITVYRVLDVRIGNLVGSNVWTLQPLHSGL